MIDYLFSSGIIALLLWAIKKLNYINHKTTYMDTVLRTCDPEYSYYMEALDRSKRNE